MRSTVARGGGEIACEVIDHAPAWEEPAPTVLFHHGVGACGAVWDGWTPTLVNRFRLVRFDLRGHGASPLPPGFEWSLDAAVDDLEAVASAAGADRFHLANRWEAPSRSHSRPGARTACSRSRYRTGRT